MRMEHRQIQGLILTETEELYLECLESNAFTIMERFGGTVPQDYFDTISESDETLSSHMASLLPLLRLDGVEEEVADYLIYNLDDRGNLLVEDEEITERFGIKRSTLERIKESLRSIGPEGLFEGTVRGFGRPASKLIPDLVILEDLSVEVFTPPLLNPSPALEKALIKRERTLRKLGEIVVESNASFFLNERPLPRRMKIKDLASAMGVSISTASRAVKDKYVSSIRGTFPLKLFFGRSIHPEMIRRLIEEISEEYGKVSDAFIAERIRSMGYQISRRTVNKYRRGMR